MDNILILKSSIMETETDNILIVILTSTVISALISGIVSLYMKRKELVVQLKLEEKNKWIENINKAHQEYINSSTEYLHGWMSYSNGDLSTEQLGDKIRGNHNSYTSLLFYLYQSEYNSLSIAQIKSYMEENSSYHTELRKKIMEYLEITIKTDTDAYTLTEKMTETEEKIGSNNNKFSIKLGEMVRNDKELMTAEIININFLRRLFSKRK